MGTLLILKMTLYLVPRGGCRRGFALSYHEEIHAFLLEYMFTLCLKAFVYSFKTFNKLEKTATTVFCFMSKNCMLCVYFRSITWCHNLQHI